ncbi:MULTISPECIES: SixA phosphatase family protein [Rhizobium]|jgi:phosphohistidine phosphatase|uniref:Phosphohistidine phosphatase n=1 Tax=Rhizobium metallidurans TaxID=1265931 RepID=A0A7W6GCZ2_9HYPH|nr:MULTISPECIES: histidine phosphatase family protein [Rhizobium]MBB3966339.1 phosphohistidine phosphatase [Rhizobium metallidurans]MBO9194423.1 histidine phosphatase family protein [Rhizobium sp. 16-449-1b]
MTAIVPPPSRIYLLRHAEAAFPAPGQSDFDRPLSERGYAAAEILAENAADKSYKPDLVVSSTAIRCRQTADAVHRAMGENLDIRFVDALYNATPEIYLDILGAQQDMGAVMLVGHNPVIEQTLEALIGHQLLAQALPNGFPPGGLAVLDFDQGRNNWRLIDFMID